MQIKKIRFFVLFVFLIIFGSAIFIGRVFVYDTNIAHPGLTRLSAELYNNKLEQGSLPKLSQKEINWLMAGAIEEDTPLRWMNHFYDPVHNLGLKGAYDSAKVWSKNYQHQTNYSKGNQSWQEAIYQYQKGDYEKAFTALGHILHLIEDMSVPAHTRDDAHPEGDPYEQWVKKNFKALPAEPIYFNELDKYFDFVANFSNNNFYSKDTIGSKRYSEIKIIDSKNEILEEGNDYDVFYGKINNIRYPLFFSQSASNYWKSFVGDFINDNVLLLDDPLILSSHFSLLAPKSIGAGAGIIKLFFEETQKQQNYTPPFWQISPLGIIQESAVGSVTTAAYATVNLTTQFQNLWNSAKDMIVNFGDKTTNVSFLSEAWKTQAVLASEVKNLVEAKNNLVAAPLKIAMETGSGVGNFVEGAWDNAQNSESAANILSALENRARQNTIKIPALTPAKSAPSPAQSLTLSTPSAVLDNSASYYFLTEPTASANQAVPSAQSANTNLYAGGSSKSGPGGSGSGPGGSGSGSGGSSNSSSGSGGSVSTNSNSNSTASTAGAASTNSSSQGAGNSNNTENQTQISSNTTSTTSNTSFGASSSSTVSSQAGNLSTTSTASQAGSSSTSTTETTTPAEEPAPKPPPAPQPPPEPIPPPDTASPDAPIILEPSPIPNFTTSTEINFKILVSADTHSLIINAEYFFTSADVLKFTYQLSEGKNIFNFNATDLAGNTSATTSIKIIKDTAPPTPKISATAASSSAPDENHTIINLSWSAEDVGSGVNDFDIEYRQNEIGATPAIHGAPPAPDSAGASSTAPTDWQELFSKTTSTSSKFSGEEGREYVFRVKVRDAIGNASDWVESAPFEIALSKVIINEIAWGGTKASSNDEWMELYNASDFETDLSGWTLTDGNDIKINFSSSTNKKIRAGGFYLLERTDDKTISNRAMDFISKGSKGYTGSLNDGGEKLELRDARGRLIDLVNISARWFAGRNEYDRESMERKNPLASGSDAANWQNTPLPVWQGYDANGDFISGTPKSPNSPFVYLNGDLTQDRVLSGAGGPYFLGFLTVASGTVLKIESGAVILAGVGSNLQVTGELVIEGIAEQPVIFTSFGDEKYRSDHYRSDKIWGYIHGLAGGKISFKNTIFNFGNSNADGRRLPGLIVVESGSLTLDNAVFDKNEASGEMPLLNLIDSSVVIKNSSFTGSFKAAVLKGGSAVFENNHFEGLKLSAIEAENVEPAILKGNTFKDNGWEYLKRDWWMRPDPLWSPVFFKNSVPEVKENIFENNLLNALEIFGALASSSVIDASEYPWVVGNLFVPRDITLEIKAGSILKFSSNLGLTVSGSLKVWGEEGKPVIMTSLHDDSDGRDIDLGDAREPNKVGLEWSGIKIESLLTSAINYLRVRYANAPNNGSVSVKQTPLSVDNLTIENARQPGRALYLEAADDAIFTNLFIKNETKKPLDISQEEQSIGIWLKAGRPTIRDATLDTFNQGIIFEGLPMPEPFLDSITFFNVDIEKSL